MRLVDGQFTYTYKTNPGINYCYCNVVGFYFF